LFCLLFSAKTVTAKGDRVLIWSTEGRPNPISVEQGHLVRYESPACRTEGSRNIAEGARRAGGEPLIYPPWRGPNLLTGKPGA